MDSRAYRDVWGNFPTGVTVVTTNVDGMLHGMTANGVTSVSLEPRLMLVCVTRGNRCHQQLQAAGRFGVSFLGADQEAMSTLFARSGEPEPGALRGAGYHLGPEGTPVLDGCLAWLECAVKNVVAGGDHDIFIGEALSGSIDRPDDPPVVFFRGGYRGLTDAG